MVVGELVKQNPFLKYIYDKVSLVLEIKPYYIHREFLSEEGNLNIEPKLNDYTVDFLNPTEIKDISASAEVPESEDVLLGRLSNGCRCVGLKNKGEIAAYTWVNLRKCDEPWLVFPLKEHEAYLFDARAFKVYRGKNLVPYLRYQLYKYLAQIGRTEFLSLTFALNTSSLNFKKKLKARPLKLCLYVNLLQRFGWHILLKSYPR